MVVDAPAKINLFLEVLGKRPDGFHDISSLFQAISLSDTLTVRPLDRPGLDLTVKGAPDLSSGDDNIIVQAFRMLEKRFALPSGISVELDKRIPIAAGLGGGSSDAAATIVACNELFQLGLSSADMAQVGAEIGSDLPFFFGSGQALVSGRGEIVKPTNFPTDYLLVLVYPGLTVSTAEAYRELSLGLTKSKAANTLTPCRDVGKLMSSLRLAGNDFERVQFRKYFVLREIRDVLVAGGALLARMSGSGPTMFGIFVADATASVKRLMDQHPWDYVIAKPVDTPQA